MAMFSYNGTANTPATVQSYTVQQAGTYDIAAYGGQGGAVGSGGGPTPGKGGYGAETGGYFNLVAGEKLKIVVGGAGKYGFNGGGGGGGTFVLGSVNGGAYTLLLAAGGGGGAFFRDAGGGNGGSATAATSSPGSGKGGTGGNGGGGGGGAGFTSGGGTGTGGASQGIGASSYQAFGTGGRYGGNGGFGGGGGGGNNLAGGGGGGYSGGNGGGGGSPGTGGTSINKGTPIAAQTLVATTRTGAGQASVTLALSIALADDTGSSNNDGLTKDDTVTGTARNAGTITFTDGNGNTLGTYSTIEANQTYTFNPGNKLAQGAGTITATETANGVPISSSVALTYDSTPPVNSSPTLTVAQNSGATPIGIGAPTDNVTPTGSLAIAAGTLPSDGTVTLSDGKTAVTPGESLTSAQLQGLEFTPTQGASGQSSAFTYTVTDAAGNQSTGTATLNISSPPPPPAPQPAPPPPSKPTITGTHVTADAGEATVTPFGASAAGGPVVIADSNAGATDSLAITLTGGGGTLSGAGLTGSGNSYSLAATDPGTLTSELDALTFTPTAGAPGVANSTTFALAVASNAGTSATDSNTVVTDTAAAAPTPAPIPPTPVQPTPPTPAPAQPTPAAPTSIVPDAVAISPVVRYADGVFTLTGTAFSAAGVAKVEITADVDGISTDLGAATVDANGNFSFKDPLGSSLQTFFRATLTDGAAGTATSADPGFSLQGGLPGGRAEQDRYTTDGSAVTATDVFKRNGSQNARLFAPGGETFASSFFDTFHNGEAPLSTFVFDPGFGRDVVDGFRPDNVDHDTLSFKGADYGNSIAAVLANARDTGAGLLITDPVPSSPGTGPGHNDMLLLRGITKQTLTQYQNQDIAFHA